MRIGSETRRCVEGRRWVVVVQEKEGVVGSPALEASGTRIPSEQPNTDERQTRDGNPRYDEDHPAMENVG